MIAHQPSTLATIDDARRNLTAGPPTATLRGGSWHGVAIDELSGYRVSNMAVGPRDHHLLVINLADHPYVRSKRCGRVYESVGRSGEAAIVPVGEGSIWDGNVPPHITVRIPPPAIVDATNTIGRSRAHDAALANEFRLRDPFIAGLTTILRLEIARALHPAQAVLMESLVTALLLHLVRGYAGSPWRDESPPTDVAPAALRRALSYIEDQPLGRVTLDELADAAGLSRFHFSRVFRKHLGVSPSAYVERSRLERAKAMIRVGQLSLADIAYGVAFADQSHFTRRFRHQEGCTPAQYAREYGFNGVPKRRG